MKVLLIIGMLLCVYPVISPMVLKYSQEEFTCEADAIGIIKIPKIDIELPIYHGTSEEILEKGVGLIEGSSFPIGGKNRHTLLAGHRGLPGAELFTRLNEMKIGDLFYIDVNHETLCYQVCKISVVKPEDTECLRIQPNRDFVSLITCTPYGINTHRLIVTGERKEKE